MPSIEQARAWYQDADPIHDFDHVLRVHEMATRLAKEAGADVEIVQAAALLHDAQGSTPGVEELRANHHEASAAFAREALEAEGWPEERIAAVEHCIRAHRYRGGERPESVEAQVLFDADKLDVLGAIGAARTIGYAVLAGEPIYSEPSEQFKQTGEKVDGEPHSSYHEYLFKLRRVAGKLHTQAAKGIAKERETYLDEFYRRLGAEMRAEE
ncbi:MAG: HD domain-containing protein [Anaerolineae bacterium]|nr:HD domain-containing protein [Anaerolineae bacterium]